MDTRHALRGVVPLLVTALMLTACSSGSTTPSTAASTAAAASKRTDVDSLRAVAKDFAFTLNVTSLHPGLPGVDVVFDNTGQVTHTLTFYSDAAYTTKIPKADSGQVPPGSTDAFPFLVPDGVTTVYYRCEIHPTKMQGQLPVQ